MTSLDMNEWNWIDLVPKEWVREFMHEEDQFLLLREQSASCNLCNHMQSLKCRMKKPRLCTFVEEVHPDMIIHSRRITPCVSSCHRNISVRSVESPLLRKRAEQALEADEKRREEEAEKRLDAAAATAEEAARSAEQAKAEVSFDSVNADVHGFLQNVVLSFCIII